MWGQDFRFMFKKKRITSSNLFLYPLFVFVTSLTIIKEKNRQVKILLFLEKKKRKKKVISCNKLSRKSKKNNAEAN